MKVKVELNPGCDGWLSFYQNLGYHFPMHHHDELEFNLVDRGSGVYLLQDRKYVLHRHSFVWLFPDQEHVLLEQSPDFKMWIGKFCPNLIQRACTTPDAHPLLETNPAGFFCRHIKEEQSAHLISLMSMLLGQDKNTGIFNAGLAYIMLVAWQVYQTSDDLPSGTDVHPAVEKAAHLLRDETKPLRVEELGRLAGLSPDHLARLFKQQTGVSLVEFRNQQRMARFFRLYGGGHHKTMLQAALEAGFGSYPQFHRVFRQQMGCSPADHRRSTSQYST